MYRASPYARNGISQFPKMASYGIRMIAIPAQKQNRLPASFYRGGTSKALMFQRQHLPSDVSKWSSIFLSAMGSPDPNLRQLDGLGGGVSSTSKVCIIGPSDHPEADVDYTFVAIGVNDMTVDFSSNCGNMTSAVGPFAVDQGLVEASDGRTTVRIHNTNTGKLIHSTFDVVGGEAVASGDFEINGVSGKASKIELAFLDPSGSKTGRLLPTGNIVDTLDGVKATCVDCGNPCVIVQAADLNVDGAILPEKLDSRSDILSRLDNIRRQASVAMGLSKDESTVPESVPKIVMVSKSSTHKLLSSEILASDSMDLVVRAISVRQPHRAVPITVALAIAAASKLQGSIVQVNLSAKPSDPDGITLGHPSGRIVVGAKFDAQGEVISGTVYRTARRLMEGQVYWK